MRRALAALSAAALALPALAGAQSAGAAPLLVTPQQLARELRNPSLVLLYVGPKEDYDAGHIEGARFVEMGDLAAPRAAGALSLELPDESELRSRLERLGIGDSSRVVVTGGQDWYSPPTRVVWTLQIAGLASRTRLLDGGTEEWKRAGLPLTTTVPAAATPGKLTRSQDRSALADHAWVQARLRAPGLRVIDARAPAFYEGPGMSNHKAGHLPGAANVPFNSLGDDVGRMLPLDALRQRFREAGVQPGDTVVAYCHVGQQATVVVFAARLLGHPVRLYDGSMDDWERRGLPLENGKAPGSSERREPR
jgi:thiosulfate/3-mercaptopyruvate sulfurtransferase